MELAHPDRLLWLLLLPVLFLITVRRRPAKEVETAHLGVWDQVLRRRAPKRRRLLRFLLFALAFALVDLAAADPTVDRQEGPSRAVVLFDASASTGARSDREPGSGRRIFDRLRARVVEEASRWPVDARFRVAWIGRRAQVLEMTAGEVDRVLPRDPLAEPNEVELGPLLQSTAALPDTMVWSLGDVASPRSSSVRTTMLSGAGTVNRAIVEAEVIDRWPLDDVEVRLGLRGVGPGTSFRLAGGAELVEVLPEGEGSASVEPGEGDFVRLRALLRRTAGGPVVLGLAESDLLPADDRIAFRIPRPIAPVFAVSASGRFAEVVGRFLADRTGGRIVEVEETRRADCLVTDGGRLEQVPARGLTFGTWIGQQPDSVPQAEPRLVDWNRAHPLTAGLDLSELRVQRTLPAVSLPSGAQVEVLLSGPDGPLMVVREQGAQRSLHAAFQLEDSNLATLPAFPRLLERALRFVLRGERARPEIPVQGLLDLRESREAERSLPEQEAILPEPARPGFRLTPLLALLAALILGLRALT